MGPGVVDLPTHETLEVQDYETLYKNKSWWRAVVNYCFKENPDSRRTAVYQWNQNDGAWTRKQKYSIRSLEGWEQDASAVLHLLNNPEESSEFDTIDPTVVPMSDYYSKTDAVTIFQNDEWWKAVVRIDEKGSFEVDELYVYLWQLNERDWRRRQKLRIKSEEAWVEEAEIIGKMAHDWLGDADESDHSKTSGPPARAPDTDMATSVSDELEKLKKEIADRSTE